MRVLKIVGFGFLLLLLQLVFSCKDTEKQNQVVISGSFDNTKGETVYLEELGIKDLIIQDSSKINASGEFTFRFELNDPAFYVIKLSPTNFFTLLVSKGEHIELSGDAMELARTYRVKNSEGSVLLWQLDSAKRSVFKQFDSLRSIWDENRNAPNNLEIRNHLDSVANLIIKEHKNWLLAFISLHDGSLANLIAVWQTIGQRPMFTLEEDLSVFEMIQTNLIAHFQEHPHALDLSRRVVDYKKLLAEKKLTEQSLMPGKIIPDLKLPDPELKIRSLRDYRGKNVFLYFWSSRTTQCRYDNLELVSLYQRYSPYGFEIFQVGLDADMDMWKTNIRIDKLKHPQVFGNDQVAGLFNVDSIPRSFLIDTAGVILFRDISMEELKNQLRRLYPTVGQRQRP
jgi:hypothetical protein